MSDRIRVELTPASFTLVPGSPSTAAGIVVHNASSIVDQLQVSVEGLETDWYTLSTTSVNLFPGEHAELQLELSAPANALAGPRVFQVVATSRDNPSESTSASASLEVVPIALAPGLLAEIELAIEPARQVARGNGTRQFTLHAKSHRNQDQLIQFLATDPDLQLELHVGPEQLLVPAGGEATSVVDARPRRRPLIGQPVSYPFTVSAVPADDLVSPPLAGVTAELVHQPRLGSVPLLSGLPMALRQRLPLALAGLLAAALLIWFLNGPGLRSGGIQERTPTPTPAVAAGPAGGPSPSAVAKPVAAAVGGNGAPGVPPSISHFGLGRPDDVAPAFLPLAWAASNAESTEVQRSPLEPQPPGAVEHRQYVLHVANAAGATAQPFNLYVLRPPRIEAFTYTISQVGDRVILTYRTAGAERVLLNGTPLTEPSGSIELAGVQVDFELRAINGVGEVTRRLTQAGGAAGTPTSPPTAQATATPTPAATSTAVPSAVPSPVPSSSPTPVPAATHTVAPTAAPTDTPAPVPTNTSTPVPAPTETPTLTPEPTDTPTPEPEPTHTATPVPEPTDTPTPTPTVEPTVLIPVPVAQGDTRWGIAEGFRNTAAMDDTHANWERIVLSWQDVQPDNPTTFRLGQTIADAQVQGEINRGVKLAGLLQFTPGWAQADGSLGQRSPPRNLNLPYDHPDNYWGRFVYETVKFYAGRIDEWVIWNEPEFRPGDAGAGGSYTWQGTDAEFAQLLKVAYLAAKRANPNATISFPGTSYWVDQNSGRAQFYDRLLQVMQSDPQAVSLGFYHDAVSLNLYRTPDDLLRVYVLFKEIQARHGIDKPVWLSESNAMPTDDKQIAPCDHAGDGIPTSMEEQAAYVVQAFAMGGAAGYGRIGFYKMIDGNPCTEPAVWGAVRDDGSRRPAADALRTAITNFVGFLHAQFVPLARAQQLWPAWPDDPSSYTPNWQVYQVAYDKPGNQRVTVLWNGDGPQSTESRAVSSGPQPPGGLTVRILKRGASAHAIDKRGQPYPYFQEQGGYWVVYLQPATATFVDDPPGYHFIGGNPVLILEDGVNPNAPVDPPQLLEAAAPAAGATPGPGTGTTGGSPDFRLAVNPADGQTIGLGEAADYTINTQALNGFSGPIQLRIVEWSTQRFPDPKPADTLPLSVSLPPSTTAGVAARLRIQTTSGDEPGIYYLVLEASGAGISKTIEVALVID